MRINLINVMRDHKKPPWSPVTIAELNGQVVQMASFKGEYPKGFHTHDYDEMFYVLQGEVEIQYKDKDNVLLRNSEMLIVPAGVGHCPKSEHYSYVIMFEPRTTDTSS